MPMPCKQIMKKISEKDLTDYLSFLSDLYVINVSLIAGCPGLVPGWRAFPAIYRVLLSTPPPFLSRPSRNTAWARKERGRGARWQLRIVALSRAPPRHKTGAASEALNRYSDFVRQIPSEISLPHIALAANLLLRTHWRNPSPQDETGWNDVNSRNRYGDHRCSRFGHKRPSYQDLRSS